MAKIDLKWECGECGDLYDEEDDAVDCCRPVIYERFKCTACSAIHNDEDVALMCCDADAEPAGPTPQELEAAGQMRLAL